MKAYQEAGFEVGYNFPYVGGGVTRMYGQPDEGFHNIQIELNRRLYMDEETKQIIPSVFSKTQEKIRKALVILMDNLKGKGFLGE